MPGPFDFPMQGFRPMQGFQPMQGFDVGAGAGLPPMGPEEQAGLLARLGGNTLGGLQWVGETLDKALGGRALRGVLGGKPHELLSLIPFSDTLGITDPSNAVQGADLITPERYNQGFMDHALGVGLEMALDPATYLTFGTSALTKTGRLAEKAGVLPKTLGGRIRGLAAGSPELAELAAHSGLPAADLAGPLGGFANFFGQTIGTGQTAEKAADLLGKGWDKLAYSKPGRVVSAMFDPNVTIGGSTFRSEAMQRASRDAQQPLGEALTNVLGEHLRDVNTIQQHGLQDSARELRGIAEGTWPGPYYPPGAQQVAGSWRQDITQMLDQARTSGRDIGEYVSEHGDYFPRHATPLPDAAKGGNRFPDFTTTTPNQYRRSEALREIPGETNAVNDLLKDPAAKAPLGQRVTPQADYVRHQYLGWDAATETEFQTLTKLNPPERIITNGVSHPNPDFLRLQELAAQHQKSFDMARFAQHTDEAFVRDGLEYFGNHPQADLTQAKLRHAEAQAGTDVIYNGLAKVASDVAEPGSMPLMDVLRQANLKDHNVLDAAGNVVGQIGAGQQMAQRLGITPADLKNLHVPAEVAGDVLRWNRTFQVPAAIKPVVDLFDSITNLTKAYQTSLWPAFHSRNFMTGAYMNLVTGATYGGDLITPFRDAMALRGGGLVAGANKFPGLTHLTEQEATRALSEEMFKLQVRHDARKALAGETIGLVPQMDPLVGKVAHPLDTPQPGLGDIFKSYVDFSGPGSRNPLNVAGVGGHSDTAFAPVKAGREMAGYVDDLNRMSSYLAFRQQGYVPEMAAAKAKAAHYDYSRLTPFEQNVMRRVIPFYSWVRNNTPFMLEQVMKEPGGRVAQSIRVANEMRPQGGFTPDHIAEGLSIPMGGQDEQGNQRYLTRFGLPFEDAFSFLSGGPNALQRSMQKVLGQTNPIIKAPLEYAAGKQFYSGRDLEDLYSRSGTGVTALDQLLMNSPVGRAVTTVSTLTDPRKGPGALAANLLAPAHVTDVNMPQQQRVAAREYIQDSLRGSPNVGNFEQLYVRPENIPNLSPQEAELMRLYQGMARDARQHSHQQGGRNFRIPVN